MSKQFHAVGNALKNKLTILYMKDDDNDKTNKYLVIVLWVFILFWVILGIFIKLKIGIFGFKL